MQDDAVQSFPPSVLADFEEETQAVPQNECDQLPRHTLSGAFKIGESQVAVTPTLLTGLGGDSIDKIRAPVNA